ncbi:MAG TPA: RidA family protein [Acidimicrobiia bacterium]|nr:RidA family protein [Acidimicrobiia bacterium]
MAIDRLRTGETSYSDSVAVSGPGTWLHIAGQLAFDDDRRLIEGGVAAQAHRCLDRIDALVVEAGGSGLANVVAITVYLLSLEDYPAFNRVRAERFGEDRPASAAVQVAGLLFGGEIEIAAVAFVPDQ